mgnify:CR=1 FL=1
MFESRRKGPQIAIIDSDEDRTGIQHARQFVRIVQLTTGTVYYADPAPTGEFAMPFTSSGRYK